MPNAFDALLPATRALMRLPLDPHIYLCWVLDDWQLPPLTGSIRSYANPKQLAEAIEPSGFDELPLRDGHAAADASISPRGKKPFDRVLIAQSLTAPLTLSYADAAVAAGGPPVKPSCVARYS
jgi:hypothetical protein